MLSPEQQLPETSWPKKRRERMDSLDMADMLSQSCDAMGVGVMKTIFEHNYGMVC